MNLTHYVGKGVAWNTIALGLGKLVIFANVFLILHLLTVYEYGFSELVMSIVTSAGIAFLPGLTNAIISDLAVERGRKNTAQMNLIFHQHLLLGIALGTITWAALFFLATPVATRAGISYAAHFLQIASFTFLIAPFRTASQTLATVMLRFFDQSFYTVFEECFKLFFILLFLAWFHLGITGLLLAIVCSQFLTVLAFLPRTLSAYSFFADAAVPERMQFWRLLLSHRRWSIGASYISTLSQNVRLWIIKLMLGTEAVGLFSLAYGVFSHAVSLLPLSSLLPPVVAHYTERRDELVRIIRASIKVQLVLATIFFVGGLLFIKLFIGIFFTKYLPSIPIVYPILFALLPSAVISVVTPVFSAFKEQRSLFFAIGFKTALMLIFLPASIFFFGISGAGVEITLTTLGSSVERYLRLKNLMPDFSFDVRHTFRPDPLERAAIRSLTDQIVEMAVNWGSFLRR